MVRYRPLLEFGKRYRITRHDVIASQDSDLRTNLRTEIDRPIPVGTVVTVWDPMEWNSYSESLRDEGLNPGFYYVEVESPLPEFVSTKLIVLAHVLEKGVEEVS